MSSFWNFKAIALQRSANSFILIYITERCPNKIKEKKEKSF